MTSNDITLTHYGDTSTTGTNKTFKASDADSRITDSPDGTNYRNHVYHSFEGSLSTDDETYGFEPIFVTGFYKVVRDHTR